jgi:4-oxalocrotonate tautomerase
MPCIEVTMPRTDAAARERLARALTHAFACAIGFDEDILGVHFREYGPGEAAVGGRLWSGEGRPYLHLVVSSRSQKQRAVADLTAAFAECVGRPDWKPVIHLAEHPYDNVGVEGKLLTDAYEECARRTFYYDLPRD